jgi:hypothetical protein
MLYIAGGLPVSILEQVSLSAAGRAAAGVGVSWTVSSGPVGLAAGGSVSGAQGLAGVTATLGPLAAGAQAVGSACAWTAVCAGFTGVGVDPAAWLPGVMLGGSQVVAAGEVLLPVVLEVTDGAGHAVVGASVQISQTVEGYQDCPAQGRCPTAPVYSTTSSTVVSDINGLVVVAPAQVGGAEITRIAVATGTQGFLTLALTKTP